MSNPNNTHFRALDRIWKYLNNYPTLGTNYNYNIPDSLFELLGYCDADQGGDNIIRKSTTGYLFLLGLKNILSQNSILQKSVALSSCESEYIALREAIKELLYLYNITKVFKTIAKIPISNTIPTILTDSELAIKLANNLEFYKRSKHIDITYYFIRETIKDKKVQLHYVNTKD